MSETLRKIPMARFTRETAMRLEAIRERAATRSKYYGEIATEDVTFLLNLVGESEHTLAALGERLEAVKAELAALKECPPTVLALKPPDPAEPVRREVARPVRPAFPHGPAVPPGG